MKRNRGEKRFIDRVEDGLMGQFALFIRAAGQQQNKHFQLFSINIFFYNATEKKEVNFTVLLTVTDLNIIL